MDLEDSGICETCGNGMYPTCGVCDPCPSCPEKDAELTRLRAALARCEATEADAATQEARFLGLEEKQHELDREIRWVRARAEKAEGALCRAREWLVTAKTLNGTECSFHDPFRKKYAISERCGKCILCLIDYAMTVHLNASPCPHELAEKRLAEDHVAYLCYHEHGDHPTTIHICDSDFPGAFKVYRRRAVSRWLKEGK